MIFIGNLTTRASGYAQAALNHLGSLVATGYRDIVFAPLQHGPIPWQTFPAEFDALRALPGGADRGLALLHDTIDQLACVPTQPGTRYLAMTALDADRCPAWCGRGVSLRFERLIVPSEHSAAAARRGRVEIPIHVVPHCAHPRWWEQPLPPVEKSPAQFLFYYIGSWTPRKNPEAIVRAFCAAFPEPGASYAVLIPRLYLKVTGPASQIEVVREVAREASAVALQRELPEGWTRPDVIAAAGHLAEDDLRRIHAFGDCYVSAHRGEAFGQAILEAALLGRPVIATDWSGPVEYLNAARGDLLVGCDLVPVRGMESYVQYGGGLQWAEPRQEALVAALQTMLREPRSGAVAELRSRYCWEAQGPAFRAALEAR